MNQLTFESVCKQLQKDASFTEITDNLNVLSGAAILLLGIREISGDVTAFVNALTIKNELTSISKSVLDKIIKRKSDQYAKRIESMKYAYSMIYYTAFFDELDVQMTDEIRNKISLTTKEKRNLFQKFVFENIHRNDRKNSILQTEIYFPNISNNYIDIEKQLFELYSSMRDGLTKFVHMLSFEEVSDEKTVAQFHDIEECLPQSAVNRFKSQYVYLAGNFNEFYVLMQIENCKRRDRHVDALYKNLISVGCDVNTKIDVGLKKLETILVHLPEKSYESKIKNIVDCLIEHYKSEIDKPIIDSKKNEDEKLNYPSINKAFIPQSYKILNYSGKEPLEKESTWMKIKEQEKMNAFWAEYYASPYSLENLLLILGEPGGGKSLLTKILCARMIDRDQVLIRIPLREISVEKEIDQIVCEQIQKDGDASEHIQTFKWFSEAFQSNAITIIFDGYDEVLQATGHVYRNLLKKILHFQNNCYERHRPVRIVVTSRETLIDKADIPIGTVVLKLMEFNNDQRSKWIQIWNERNDDIFKMENINPFVLPENNESIEELSRQPLLLLMLAIYDANIEEGMNSLSTENNLDRTKLYNELLRRFIRRELKKGNRGNEVAFDDVTKDEQEEMVNQEQEKLGIAALGMFLRQKLSLKETEMEKDLYNMGVSVPEYEKRGKMLSKSEILFGSFFFIHDSQSGSSEVGDKSEAFEFLHKTFYEFLVADLVLKYLIKEIDALNELRCSRNRNNYQKALDDPNYLGRQYYTTLMFTHLCKEPEIIQIMLEWKECLINDYFNADQKAFDVTISELFNKQIDAICNSILFPDIWKDNAYDLDFQRPYLQYCATYLFNLLILQTVTNESQLTIVHFDNWAYVSQFWKMNISEEILLKFTTLFSVSIVDDLIYIKKNTVIKNIEQKNTLERKIEISNFIKDDISYNLYMLHTDIPSKQRNLRNLITYGITMQFDIVLEDIQNFISGKNKNFNLARNINQGCRVISECKPDSTLIFNWLHCIITVTDEICLKTSVFKAVSHLISIIFELYYKRYYIVNELLNWLGKIRYVNLNLKNTNALRLLNTWLFSEPQIIITYLKTVVDYIGRDELYDLFKEIDHSFLKIMDTDYTSAVELVYIFASYFVSAQMEREMIGLLKLLLQNDIELIYRQGTLEKLQDMCMQYGEQKEFKKFLILKFPINKVIQYNPEKTVGFLEICLNVKMEEDYVETISKHIIKHFKKIINDYPELLKKINRLIYLSKELTLNKLLIRHVLQLFEIIFARVPKEAIYFLKMASEFESGSSLDYALEYSKKNIYFLMTRSMDAAIELILMISNLHDRVFCISDCLDYILCNYKPADANIICDLFHVLKSEELYLLRIKLLEMYYFIIIKYPKLAKEIADVYGHTDYKNQFLKIIDDLKNQGTINPEYLNELYKKLV